MACVEATVSTQPVLPQVQTRSPPPTGRCPTSPDTPCAPDTTRPPMDRPQPIPAPHRDQCEGGQADARADHCSATVSAPHVVLDHRRGAGGRRHQLRQRHPAPVEEGRVLHGAGLSVDVPGDGDADCCARRPPAGRPRPPAVGRPAGRWPARRSRRPGERSVARPVASGWVVRSVSTPISSSAVTLTPTKRARSARTAISVAGRPLARSTTGRPTSVIQPSASREWPPWSPRPVDSPVRRPVSARVSGPLREEGLEDQSGGGRPVGERHTADHTFPRKVRKVRDMARASLFERAEWRL